MSDTFVQFQEWLAQYPTWMVAGGVGFAVVVLVILVWKAMRIMVTALVVAILVAIGWYVWERVSTPDADPVAPATVAPASVPAAPVE